MADEPASADGLGLDAKAVKGMTEELERFKEESQQLANCLKDN